MSKHQTQQTLQSPIQSVASQFIHSLTSLRQEAPLPAQPALGFFTDTSICIGCKACEVACKQWNQLPATDPVWTGTSYDNTGQLGGTTWRHVQFIEQVQRPQPRPTPVIALEQVQRAQPRPTPVVALEQLQPALSQPTPAIAIEPITQPVPLPELPLFVDRIAAAREDGTIPATPPGTALPFFNSSRWLMHSDVCKHCANAPCQEACPTGAIIRTEFDTVYVQQDICNGCGYCIVACPFGVVARDDKGDHLAHKCTLCYDRLKDGMEPACAKACPTKSIVFGEVAQLKQQAQERVGLLQARGLPEARLYGADDSILEGGLHSFFLLLDEPEVYNLPQNPPRPSDNVLPTSFWTIIAAAIIGLMGILFFKQD